VVSSQQVIIAQHWSMMNALLVFLEYVNMPPRIQGIWKYEEAIGYMEN